MQQIKLIVMDVDGVLTDGRIILGKEEELKFFGVRDGMGITIAKRSGLKVGIITSRTSEAVERRAKELKMDYIIQGCENKLETLNEILKIENLGYQNVCYIGDDIIDIPLFRKVGFSATVNDAPDIVKSEVSYVSNKAGGRGAVRDIIEYVLKCKGILNSTIDAMISDWSTDIYKGR
jgi:3-deoxy-D-manno-octulosonate 8-phosphate phosphatase (KDO 8-P phosphatase)